MLITLNELLRREHVPVGDSIYGGDDEGVCNFHISSGDFYEICENQKSGGLYAVPGGEGREERRTAEEAGRKEDEERLEAVRKRLKMLKNDEEDLTHAHADEIKALRKEKKYLMDKLASGEQEQKRCFIRFKNSLNAMSLGAVSSYIPQMEKVQFRNCRSMPFFTANLPKLKRAVEEKHAIGVSGGPCLFGVNEVIVNVVLADGTKHSYDFSSGRNYVKADHQGSFAGDMEAFGDSVVSMSFENNKKGVTTQEYDSIHCLFECAQALHAKLAIPLPDMSYIKYFHNISEHIPEKLRARARREFRAEAYRISDMYCEVIRAMKKDYPETEIAVVHERDEELCRLFYKGRESFLTDKVVQRLTNIKGKSESIQDYVTMPALPYYIWGIRDIVQMDSLDETDSYRKSAKIHRGTLNLCAMLYPERVSADGKNTIFYTSLKYKEYLS